MPVLSIELEGTVEGNEFHHEFNFNLANQLESDAIQQALKAIPDTDVEEDGDLVWTWKKSENVPFSIPIDLPLGIKTVLHETLALAEQVVIIYCAIYPE